MNRLTLLCIGLAFGLHSGILAQAAYVLPSPTSAEAECTLYIDLTQCQDQRLSEMLDVYPEEEVYLWIWNPSAPLTGNGDWGDSEDSQKMTKVSEKLYSFSQITPREKFDFLIE